MQIEITYKKNADVDAPCIAMTEVRGEPLCSIGRTWEQAKERLMQKLSSYLSATAPPPETVDIKVAGEEMDTEFFKQLDPNLPWGPPETTTTTVRRAKVNFEGGQVVTAKDREIEAGKL